MNFRVVKEISIGVILLLVLGTNSLSAQIRVGPDEPVQTLEEAVTRSSPYDHIILGEGTYRIHNLKIEKPLTIEGKGKVVLDGEQKGFILKIHAENVTLRNIEIHNSSFGFMEDYAGILIEDTRNVLIENVLLVDNYFGIYVANSSDIILRNNILRSNAMRESTSGNGVHLWYSKNITIDSNEITGHRDGIYFEFVEDSRILNNTSHNNLRYGLHFMYSNRCVYTGNTFRQNGAGVAVMYTKDVEMTHNRFERNWGANAYGLLLKEIADSQISDNLFVNNTVAMYAEASNRMVVKGNDFISNGWAVRIQGNCVDNRFTENNFIENSFEVGTNSRQHYNHFEGNYWSHYEGYDLNRDGIGDVPYRPVRLFSMIIEKRPESLILLRSMIVSLLDIAERVMPVFTPKALVDEKPKMSRFQ
ncbi:MAG: nitrous oxide reductase family maturation protein NosD [Balneolaceae bacterium]